MTASTDFLPPGLLERLGGLDVIARTVVSGFQTGIHRSPHRGAGEDFARHRDYQQGDDVRYLDWKLYARTDRLYVREFEERSNLACWIVLDATASMDYASPGGVTKARYAAYLAAALSHLMLRAGDAVGLAAVADAPRLLLQPRSRRGHLHDLLMQLERAAPGGTASAADALDRVGSALRRRGRVILIGDLLADDDGDALVASAGRLRARGDEVVVFRVLTPEESGERAPDAGLFFDPEAPGEPRPATPPRTRDTPAASPRTTTPSPTGSASAGWNTCRSRQRSRWSRRWCRGSTCGGADGCFRSWLPASWPRARWPRWCRWRCT